METNENASAEHLEHLEREFVFISCCTCDRPVRASPVPSVV